MCAATAGYNPCPGSNPQAITCPGGELIRAPNPHPDIYIYTRVTLSIYIDTLV